MKVYRVAIPWILNQLGVRKWMTERAIHVPEAVLESAATAAGVSEIQWRAVEAVQAKMLYDGIVIITDTL